MSWIKSLFTSTRKKGLLSSGSLLSSKGSLPPFRDTVSAIGELSNVVKDNPDAVEIYLALGNLFRAQGEIDRAIQIRNSLIVRQNLDSKFKAKAWFELGRDYKRAGFMDRAQSAFENARNILGDDPAILEEMARLAADGSDFEKAASCYSRLENNIAQAHYLVRQSHEYRQKGENQSAGKLLNKAFKVNPGSVEAWLEKLRLDTVEKKHTQFNNDLEQALESVPPHLAFVLLEGILDYSTLFPDTGKPRSDTQNNEGPYSQEFCTLILPVLERQPRDVLIFYYGAWFALRCGDMDSARTWLEKTLLLDPDFWPARLELLSNTMEEQQLTPVFKGQLEFFLTRARRVKRFVCLKCGLKREEIFFICPRCQAWYSISFRMSLSD